MFWINCLYWGFIVSVIAGAVWIGRRNRGLLGGAINPTVLRPILSPNTWRDETNKPELVRSVLRPDISVSQPPDPEIDPLAEEIYQAALKAGMITPTSEEKPIYRETAFELYQRLKKESEEEKRNRAFAKEKELDDFLSQCAEDSGS